MRKRYIYKDVGNSERRIRKLLTFLQANLYWGETARIKKEEVKRLMARQIDRERQTNNRKIEIGIRDFPNATSGKEPACQCRRHEMQVRSLGQEDPLEDGMATHSSILAWRISWTGEPGGLQTMGSQKVGHKQLSTQHREDKYSSSLIKLMNTGFNR